MSLHSDGSRLLIASFSIEIEDSVDEHSTAAAGEGVVE